jgi:hypothetical protein
MEIRYRLLAEMLASQLTEAHGPGSPSKKLEQYRNYTFDIGFSTTNEE